MERPKPPRRDTFPWFRTLQTRWMDNDIYGHVNNVHYYSFFDTVIAHYLIDEGGLDPWRGPVIGIAVETGCRFHRPLRFPQPIEAGLRVGRLGTSSARYEIGLFAPDADEAAADGHFVHVFVERAGNRPVPIPDPIRTALSRLLPAGPGRGG